MNYKDISKLDLPWDRLKSKSILITGANGMIASAMIGRLIEDD